MFQILQSKFDFKMKSMYPAINKPRQNPFLRQNPIPVFHNFFSTQKSKMYESKQSKSLPKQGDTIGRYYQQYDNKETHFQKNHPLYHSITQNRDSNLKKKSKNSLENPFLRKNLIRASQEYKENRNEVHEQNSNKFHLQQMKQKIFGGSHIDQYKFNKNYNHYIQQHSIVVNPPIQPPPNIDQPIPRKPSVAHLSPQLHLKLKSQKEINNYMEHVSQQSIKEPYINQFNQSSKRSAIKQYQNYQNSLKLIPSRADEGYPQELMIKGKMFYQCPIRQVY